MSVTQRFTVDEQFSEMCADTLGGSVTYDPFDDESNEPIIEHEEPPTEIENDD